MNFENLKQVVTNKDTWVKVGKGSMKLGKVIVVKGSQAVVANGVAKVLTTSFDEGISGVKNLSFDDVIGVKKDKEKKPKKKLFSKKQEEAEELLEDITENDEQAATLENETIIVQEDELTKIEKE